MACANCKKKNAARAKRLTTLDLTDRVEFESPSDTHNADGSISRSWVSDYSRWCQIEPTGGAEPDPMRAIDGHATYRFNIRYDATLAAAISASHRIVHDDGRIFDIIRVMLAAPDRITVIANDYGAITEADALTYDGTDYDAIIRDETIERPYDEPGQRTSRNLVALVRVSDFAPGITAENGTCTIRTREYRIASIWFPSRGDWYKLTLADKYGALPQR